MTTWTREFCESYVKFFLLNKKGVEKFVPQVYFVGETKHLELQFKLQKNYSNYKNFYISWDEKEFRHLFFPTFGCVISYKKLCEPIVPGAAAEAFWQGKPTKFLIRCYTLTFFLFGHDCKIVFPRNNACWICSLPGLEIRSFNLLIFDLSIFPIFKNDRRERIDLFHDRIDLSITKKWSIWSKTNDQIPNPALYTSSTLFLSFHNWLSY